MATRTKLLRTKQDQLIKGPVSITVRGRVAGANPYAYPFCRPTNCSMLDQRRKSGILGVGEAAECRTLLVRC